MSGHLYTFRVEGAENRVGTAAEVARRRLEARFRRAPGLLMPQASGVSFPGSCLTSSQRLRKLAIWLGGSQGSAAVGRSESGALRACGPVPGEFALRPSRDGDRMT